MKNEIADALVEFYQKILKPEFDAVHVKLAEHDAAFAEMAGHLDSIYHRMGRVEDELLAVNNRIDSVEGKVDRIEHRLDRVENRLDRVERRLDGVEIRLDGVESRLTKI